MGLVKYVFGLLLTGSIAYVSYFLFKNRDMLNKKEVEMENVNDIDMSK